MGRLTTLTDPRGPAYITTYTYDHSGRILTVTDAKGRVTTYLHDRVGNVYSAIGPQGPNYRTVYTFDRLNSQRTVTVAPGTPDQAITRTDYNALGLVVSTTNAINQVTTYAYDSLEHLQSMTQAFGTPDAETWHYQYDADGNLLSVTDPRGPFYTTSYVYNRLNQQVEIISPQGVPGDGHTSTVYIGHDAAGNVISQSDPRDSSIVTTYVFDMMNRLRKRIDPAGETDFDYDANGNLHSVTDADRNTTVYGYDALNRKTDVFEVDGSHTQFMYDAVGHLRFQIGPVAASDGKPAVWEYDYDLLGRLWQTIDPEGNKTTNTFDDGDNIQSTKDMRGFSNTYTRDCQNRIGGVDRQVGGGEPDVITSYVFDAFGNLKSSTDARGFVTTYILDNLNRVVQMIEPPANHGGADRETDYTYDAVGNRTSVQDPRGPYYTTNYVYDAQNHVIEEDRPQGSDSAPAPAAYRFTYDDAGNITSSIDPRNSDYTTVYTYDADNRLMQIERSNASPLGSEPDSIEKLTYDAAGNLLTRTDARGSGYVTTYSYNSRNRVATATDAAGNVTAYTYDADGNVLTQTETDATTGQVRTFVYTYDGLGRRLSETANGTFVTKWFYDETGNLVRTWPVVASVSVCVSTLPSAS